MEHLKCIVCYGKIIRYSDGSYYCEKCQEPYSEEDIQEFAENATGTQGAPYFLDSDNALYVEVPQEEEPDFSHLDWSPSYPPFGAPNAQKFAELRVAHAPLKGLVINCGDYIRTTGGRTLRSGLLRTVPEQFDTQYWKDIVQMDFGDQLVGLRADGAVISFATRNKTDDGHWFQVFGPEEQITQIAVSRRQGAQVICGLRADGTVATQCDDPEEDQIIPAVSRWSQVAALYGAYDQMLALCRDGSVLSTKTDYSYVQDVVAIAVKRYGSHPMFLHSDGTVSFSQAQIQSRDFAYTAAEAYEQIHQWRNIADIAYGGDVLIGWKADGSLVAQPVDAYNDHICQEQCQEACQWQDIVAIYSKTNGFVGLRKDGTFAYVPTADRYGQPNVGVDKLFTDFRTVRKELYNSSFRKAIREHRKKTDALLEEQSQLAAQLPELTGLFSGGRRKKIEARLQAIQQELMQLHRQEQALIEKE